MVKMTPEQEAAYALDFGVARSDLPKDAQLAYDRLVEQGACAATPPRVSQPDGEAASSRATMPKWVAAVGTAVLFPGGPGLVVVLVPWLITRWQTGQPPYPVAVRALGVVLIAAGAMVVVWTFARFPAEGTGIPSPVEPTSRQVIVGGPYRYVRNPMYVSYVLALIGLALLLSRPVLLIYTAALLLALIAVVRWLEEPALARRFGAQYEAYRRQVPGWWPRRPHRRP